MERTNQKRMHVGLSVNNIEKTVDFYQKLFDQKADKQKADYAKFILPELVISFIQSGKISDGSFGHFGFQLESSEQVHELLERAKEKGINTLEEEQVKCCYALQDKFWVTDPDGYRWEYYYFESDVEANDPSTECCTDLSSESKSECCTVQEKAESPECC